MDRRPLAPRARGQRAGQGFGSAGAPLEFEGAPTFRLDSVVVSEAVAALREELGEAESGTPQGVVRAVFDSVGLEATVAITVRDDAGDVIVEGFKRFVISASDERSTNPPPPRVQFGQAWMSGADTCVPEGEPAVARVEEEIVIAPDSDLSWLETFVALDLNGDPIEGREDAYYTWFATDGEFAARRHAASRARGAMDCAVGTRSGHGSGSSSATGISGRAPAVGSSTCAECSRPALAGC